MLNEQKCKRIPKDKTPLNTLCAEWAKIQKNPQGQNSFKSYMWGGGGGDGGEENESMYDKLA